MPFFDGPPPSDTVPIYFVTRETWPDIAVELPHRRCPVRNEFEIRTDSPARVSSFQTPTAGSRACSSDSKPHRHLIETLFCPANSSPRCQRASIVLPMRRMIRRLPSSPGRSPPIDLIATKRRNMNQPRLVPPDDIDFARIKTLAAGVTLGRDLINTPANDLGPDALEVAAVTLAAQFGAEAAITLGDDLLKENFPLIHAVGRAAEKPPRLVDFFWGPEDAPKVTLVGKGVCFDTGGLDIKPSSGMILMKKDMGGAATALALAHFIMDRGLPIRLRVLLPIVENAISASAMRPSDVYPSRKGLSVEIGNTDAEGRLILADALALADEDAPELLFDFATLTGAARVALGPDLPPFYTEDETLAAEIAKFGRAATIPSGGCRSGRLMTN